MKWENLLPVGFWRLKIPDGGQRKRWPVQRPEVWSTSVLTSRVTGGTSVTQMSSYRQVAGSPTGFENPRRTRWGSKTRQTSGSRGRECGWGWRHATCWEKPSSSPPCRRSEPTGRTWGIVVNKKNRRRKKRRRRRRRRRRKLGQKSRLTKTTFTKSEFTAMNFCEIRSLTLIRESLHCDGNCLMLLTAEKFQVTRKPSLWRSELEESWKANKRMRSDVALENVIQWNQRENIENEVSRSDVM